MTLNEDVRLAKDGGTGFNVVGELPGEAATASSLSWRPITMPTSVPATTTRAARRT